MDQIVYHCETDGLTVEQIIREQSYSMASRHFHTCYEIYYLLDGQRSYFLGSETFAVGAGDVVLIRPGCIHRTSQSGGTPHSRILLHIDGRWIDPLLAACGLPDIHSLFAVDYRILSLGEPLRSRFPARVDRLVRELQEGGQGFRSAALLETAGLLLELWRAGSTPLPSATQPLQTLKYQKVHEAARYLTEHPESQESLNELAQRFFISRSYLCRIFKEVTGLSVNEFRLVSRLKRAQQLLLHSSESITDIAASTGFESLTYFERVFRKYTDTTPSRYRRQNRPRPPLSPSP